MGFWCAMTTWCISVFGTLFFSLVFLYGIGIATLGGQRWKGAQMMAGGALGFWCTYSMGWILNHVHVVDIGLH